MVRRGGETWQAFAWDALAFANLAASQQVMKAIRPYGSFMHRTTPAERAGKGSFVPVSRCVAA
jgi:hypothetical protein